MACHLLAVLAPSARTTSPIFKRLRMASLLHSTRCSRHLGVPFAMDCPNKTEICCDSTAETQGA